MTKGIQETSLTPYKALHFGTLTIDPINRVVTLANTEISLSTADFELLWELATHAGQIMDRDALLKIYAASVMTDWIVAWTWLFRG
ncbi:DNA-binding transcriptional regulator RstA [Escherichia coli]|uniref:DNA-binding transcriptional regulator RstA n=1 Tax=Escherichia coli TaxID=562 RepID=A0A377K607_ECOLX|nr:DNA-binding transcriptional regulator RstA [Escherichia coli]